MCAFGRAGGVLFIARGGRGVSTATASIAGVRAELASCGRLGIECGTTRSFTRAQSEAGAVLGDEGG